MSPEKLPVEKNIMGNTEKKIKVLERNVSLFLRKMKPGILSQQRKW